MSPPWGGTGYNLLDRYTLDYIYPNFYAIMKSAMSVSKNIVIFLPRNTDIEELSLSLSALSEEYG